MTHTEMIIYGILSSVLFTFLCSIMHKVANYFYCDCEVEWDIIAIRIPYLCYFAIAGIALLQGFAFFAFPFAIGVLLVEIFIGTDSANQVQQNGPTQ